MKQLFLALSVVGSMLLGAAAATARQHDEPELVCNEAAQGRTWSLQVVAENGRFISEIYDQADLQGRLVQRYGVDRRPSGGREFDVLYVGRDFLLSYSSVTGEGQLKATVNGRRIELPLVCE